MASVDISIDVGAQAGINPATFPPDLLSQAVRLVDRARNRWREELLSYWPVDTGLSLRSWEATTRPDLVLVLRNPVDYSEFVRRAGDRIGEGVEHMRDVAHREVAAILPALRTLAAAADAREARLTPRPRIQRPVFEAAFRAAVEAFERVPGSIRRLEPTRQFFAQETRRRTRSRVRSR